MHQIEMKSKYGQYYVKNDSVCTKDNGEIITKNVAKHCASIIKKKVDPDFKFHHLRHTHLSMMVNLGVMLKDVQERAGHARIEITSK